MKVCFRCKNTIKEKTHHYDFVEYNDGKLIKIDSAHKECWDEFLKKLSDTTEAMGVVRGLKNYFIKQGILPAEEYIIK